MGLSRRRFTRNLKSQRYGGCSRRIGGCVGTVSGGESGLLHRWGGYRDGQGKRFLVRGGAGGTERVAHWNARSSAALEIDFLKGCLQSIEEQRHCRQAAQAAIHGKLKSSEREGSREAQVRVGQVSRSGFYRWRREKPSPMAIAVAGCAAAHRAGISQLRLAARRANCGGALAVNHKRVYRMMREDNLLCLRRRNS